MALVCCCCMSLGKGNSTAFRIEEIRDGFVYTHVNTCIHTYIQRQKLKTINLCLCFLSSYFFILHHFVVSSRCSSSSSFLPTFSSLPFHLLSSPSAYFPPQRRVHFSVLFFLPYGIFLFSFRHSWLSLSFPKPLFFFFFCSFCITFFNLLNTKRNLLYIRNQSVPRSKHFPPRL